VAQKRFYSYKEYQPHLEKLSEYVSVKVVTLTGGEAFLNKNLLQLAQGVRSSGVLSKSSILQIDSNGFWLRDWEKHVEILENIDLLRITRHPEQTIPEKEVDEILNQIGKKYCRTFNEDPPERFAKVIFYDDPVPRKKCKFCLQLTADGYVSKCHLIPYPHKNTTKSFDDLKHEGLYDIHFGNVDSFERWHTVLHPCCDFCGFLNGRDKGIPHESSKDLKS